MQRVIDVIHADHDVVQTAIEIQQIAAPTFEERQRSDEVYRRFTALGLRDVQQDEMGNVLGRRRGESDRPGILIAAHLDTVFAADTDLTTRHDGTRVYGPGIGDNSLGVAGMLHLAAALAEAELANEVDIWYGADVGEEGLGDLRGMRALVDHLAGRIDAVIALEGSGFGRVYHRGIAVRRLRIEVQGPGGHSWQDYGTPSAVHVLVELAAALSHLALPQQPKTTLNIGTIAGGTSVNAIAERASLLLDLRSEEQASLEALAKQVDDLLRAVACPPEVTIITTVVGNREGGAIPTTHPLARMAAHALQATGVQVVWGSGSTDANVPLARNIPAVCIGITRGGNAHRLDEYIETEDIPRGMEALARLVVALTTGPDTL